jgi:hypothetical protein
MIVITRLRFNLKLNFSFAFFLLLMLMVWDSSRINAQVSYGADATYSLRKTIPTYTGNVMQVRRACDNATTTVGFTSCGEADTTELKKFVLASNPLSTINLPATAAYSLRKLSCSYTGKAINVRRACDNATKDIGFTTNGDLDTTALKSFVLSGSPLSALSASSACAFSLRKLRCAYAGSAIRVRSSGGAVGDIGFTATGDLDTTALKTLVGAGNNGFVVTWYDQSGNSNNATQATTANQPQIMVAGKINRQGGATGQPALIFSVSLTSFLTIPYSAGTLNFSSASTTNVVLARTGTATPNAAIFSQAYVPNTISVSLAWNNGTAAYAPLSIGHFPTSWNIVALPTDVVLNANNIITATILSGAANTTTMSLYQNGTIAATAANKATLGAIAAQPYYIGKRWDLADYAVANMQELIVFTSVLSSTDKQYLEWGQSQYYGISGPALTTLPAGAPSAFVTKWYDQSGNAKDVLQSVATTQPRIMNAGVIHRQNSMPAIAFIASSTTTFSLNDDR